MRRLLVHLFFLLGALAPIEGCCCCCGGNWMPPSTDDEGASAEARRYLEEHRAELRRAPTDAGTSSDECVSGLGRLAADVTIAVVSRGHAGGDSASEVEIHPGKCFERVVVLVVLTAGVWHGVRAVAFDEASNEVTRTGDALEYDLYATVGSDHDYGSDEFF